MTAIYLILQTSDFLVDEEAVVWFLDEVLGRLLSSKPDGRATNEYNLRSRVAWPDTNARMHRSRDMNHSLEVAYEGKRQGNAKVWHTVLLCIESTHSSVLVCTQGAVMAYVCHFRSLKMSQTISLYPSIAHSLVLVCF